MISRTTLLLLITSFAWLPSAARAQDVNDQLEEAMKESIRKVAPSVVQIVTQGGSEMVVTTGKGQVYRKTVGPTTGVIVSADGYIITSAFNFLNNPTGILVSVPGLADPLPATKIATDRNRMLTLIKIEKTGLPVPKAVPVKEIREGQWAIALGRTLDTKREAAPSVSVGVISAVGRIWGKAVQTDAKVSPVNYGGPLIDIQGRIQGIVIPASPQISDATGLISETAGFQWYDSGIGFAIPLEDVLEVLPRLKKGQDLKAVAIAGLLGNVSGGNLEGNVAVEEVQKGSAADRAGLKAGDVILEVDGQPIQRLGHLRHILGRKYEGDVVSLKIKRGKETRELKDVVLAGTGQVVAHPFLGILPMRDDPRLGVEIRYVYPKSPAANAGLMAGDRIIQYGAAKKLQAFAGPKHARLLFTEFLNTQSPGTEIQLEVIRKAGKTETISVKLDSLIQDLPVPDKLEKGSLAKAREPVGDKPGKPDPDKRKGEKGLLKRATVTGEHKYWLFVPENYNPNVSQALLVHMHLPGKKDEKDFDEFASAWTDQCEKKNIILLMPVTENEAGWLPGDATAIAEMVRDVLERYTIDRQRIVSYGIGVGGQLALHLGFNNRDLFRGVVASGAVAAYPRDNVKDRRVAFYIASGELDPLLEYIGKSAARLREMNYPVTMTQIAKKGREPFDAAQRRDVAAWIDALDKQ